MTAARHSDAPTLRLSDRTILSVPFTWAVSALAAVGGILTSGEIAYASLKSEDTKLEFQQAATAKDVVAQEARIAKLEASLSDISGMRDDVRSILTLARGKTLGSVPVVAPGVRRPSGE